MAAAILTKKQEEFCQAIVRGLTMSAAYREAYDTKNMATNTVNRSAWELMNNQKVTARIEELRAPGIVQAGLTAEAHMLELKRLRDIALSAGKPEAAIRAEELRGKVAGLYITKIETGDPGAFQALDAQAKLSALEAIKLELDRRATLQLDVTDVEAK